MKIFKTFGKFLTKVGKMFDPSSWFKPPEIVLPPPPKPEPIPVAQPKAPMVTSVDRPEVAGAAVRKRGLGFFSENLGPKLNEIIGLASSGVPAGLMIPGRTTK
jgi:hypothetical protein